MSVNAIGQYTATHKVWDHVGNAIPPVELSEGDRPAINFRPASWLPTQFFDKFYEDYFVIMPGKGVALDNDGCLVPAGIGVAGATIVYTATDVAEGVIDVTTGSAVTTAKTVTVSDIDGSTEDFMGRSGTAIDISAFVGVCPYGYRQWAGDSSAYDDGTNPTAYRKYNYNMQHGVAIACDYLLELPLVPAQTSTESVTFTAPSAGVSTNTGDELANLPVAKNTMRTQITFADGGSGHAASLFLVEKDAAADCLTLGDWHIDLDTGVISVYSGTTTPTGITVTYYNYASAPTGANVSKFACALGDLDPGDFVKFNVDSNYIVATPATDGFDVICGQVLSISEYPRDALEKVKTAWSSALGTDATGSLPGYDGQLDQLPGTANGGVSAKIHYSGAANKVVTINLISR